MITPAVAEWIERETGLVPEIPSARPASGGCIHESWIAETRGHGGKLFVKLNRPESLPLLETELAGLRALEAADTVRVPRAFACGVVNHHACLVLEGLELVSLRSGGSAAELGRRLARLHEVESEDGRFGFETDNFIGATPQPNPWTDSWAEFFTRHRLAHQFALAGKKGRSFRDEDRLLAAVEKHLAGLSIRPALLHGDLWGGNAAALPDETPVIFDPAVYFGDPETDLAFSRLFGGFPPEFYSAYREIRPRPESIRETIYNLYHVLNHFVLFGGGYALQAEGMIAQILAELGPS